ncbi:hypothetical protein [Streptomyces subrutilus]|uniref:hypothetical protein n=1 Tax=Streptomyces subrutilus TaxID=36818 RepID=UPI001AD84A28|nr:hypothetical protein [Streptomyces subrutilus]
MAARRGPAREIVESYEGGVTLRQVMDRLASDGVLPHPVDVPAPVLPPRPGPP